MKTNIAATLILLSLICISPCFGTAEAPAPKSVNKQSWLRPALQFLAFMGYSQTRYWLRYANYIEDWQYHLNWHDQSKRWFTLDALRFDSNAFSINWTHALAGGIYYTFARSNGLSQKNAFLFTLAASAYWEYLVEWREVVSINDMLFTSVGGYVTAELYYRFARAIYNRPRRASKIIASICDPFLIINPPSRLGSGLKEERWRFSGSLTAFTGSEKRSSWPGHRPTHTLAISASVQDGTHPDPFGQIDIQFRFSNQDFSEVTLFCLVPHALQSITVDAKPAWTFNWAGAYSFYQRQRLSEYDSSSFQVRVSPEEMLSIPRNYQDKFAAIHLLGPQLHHHLSGGKLIMNHTLSFFGDFSLINALALNQYSRTHDLHPLSSTSFAYGYYYGMGISAFLESHIRLNTFGFTGHVGFSRVWAINSLDRFDEDPRLQNPGCGDSILTYSALLTYIPPSWALGLQVRLDGRQRWGQLDGIQAKESMTLFSVGLTANF